MTRDYLFQDLSQNMQPHSLSINEVLLSTKTDVKGLTQKEAALRLKNYGPNTLPEKTKTYPLFRFLKQFNSALVYILIIAAIISFIFERNVDAYVILAIIIINAFIGFIQEQRAEKAIEELKKLVTITTKVIRDNELMKLPANELVPGDLIILEEGDKVPADARLIEERELRTLEASLTGESLPVSKDITLLPLNTPLADQINMIWMSTLVASGSAKAIVVATGTNTAIGAVTHAVASIQEKKTHFHIRTDQLAWTMATIAIACSLITLIFGYFWLHFPFVKIFLFSLASLVSGIPEGLPAVLTIVLAIGAFRMARLRAVVRHLPSTETLSVVTIIATDKTGTLTQNSMTIRKILLGTGDSFEVTGVGWNPKGEFLQNKKAINPLNHSQLSELLRLALLGSAAKVLKTENGFDITGDPTEAALVVLAEKAGLVTEQITDSTPLLDELPFERQAQYRARLIKQRNENQILVVGAFERILALSDKIINKKNETEALSKTRSDAFLIQGEGFANEALRVLGLAYRTVPANTKEITHDDVKNLTFVGFMGMMDPPRPEVKEAIAAAKHAGIRVVMKTGDHRATAMAIAKEVGIIDQNSNEPALDENDLNNLSEKDFDQLVKNHSVFARITPETKLRITKSLQRQGEVVAVTGDGVNDAPALRQADIGIAMGKIGTDVAREASDLVLEDDNFATIIKAIEEGRTVFRNTQQTSFYLVTTNIAEGLTVLGALFLGLPLPLLPIQLLWMNIVTDGVTNVALASEPKHDGILLEPPRKKNERILSKKMFPFLALMVIIMFVGTVGFFIWAAPHGIDKARTTAFLFMSWAQLWNVWNMRAIDQSLFQIGIFSNRLVTASFLIGAVIQFIIIELPFFQNIFRFAPVSAGEWVAIILCTSLVLWFGELYKLITHQKLIQKTA